MKTNISQTFTFHTVHMKKSPKQFNKWKTKSQKITQDQEIVKYYDSQS